MLLRVGLATKDECICSAACEGNCNEIMFRKELEIGIKYCPSLDIDLPVYHHILTKIQRQAEQYL
jgi:hypothetical protein